MLEARIAKEKEEWTEHEEELYKFFRHSPAAEGIVSGRQSDSMIMAQQVQAEIDEDFSTEPTIVSA